MRQMLVNPLQVEGELYSRQLAVAHDSWHLSWLDANRNMLVDFQRFSVHISIPGCPWILKASQACHLGPRNWKHWKRKPFLYVVALFAKRIGASSAKKVSHHEAPMKLNCPYLKK